MDYDFLRKEGTRLLQKMSGTHWTDYNLHDPGVTILEYLCFAITDLAYRSNFDIEDLLTQKDGTIDYAGNTFIKPADALSSNPVTIKDFRKLLLDRIPGIAGVWIHSLNSRQGFDSMKGLYAFYVQPNPGVKVEQDLKELIRTNFIMNRNLCEDVSTEIHLLQPEEVFISAHLIINQNLLPENIMAQVHYAIYKFLTPEIRFYTESQLLRKGYTIDEIYSGPKLKNGFILDEELQPRNLKIDRSELYQLISEVKGVMVVSDLKINGKEDQILNIAIPCFACFSMEKSNFTIRDYSGDHMVSLKQSLVFDIYSNLKERGERHYVPGFHEVSKKELKGTYMAGDYYSIQQIFPAIYGIGKDGLPSAAGEARLVHAKQLKGYLMLFEQVMANYLAQLEGINGLFSNKFIAKTAKSYFTQALTSVPDFSVMLTDEKQEGWESYFEDLSMVSYADFLEQATESEDLCFKRKNIMLDHLLARFNETLSSYPVHQFDKVYGKTQKNLAIEKELEWKSSFLQTLTALSHARSLGFDYLAEQKDDPVYDFRKKMYQLLYIENPTDGSSLLQVFETQMKVEKVRSNPLQSTQKNVAEPLEWSFNRELSKVVSFTAAEFKEERAKGNVRPYPSNSPAGDTVFQQQPVSFLKHGINIDHYRLAVDPDQPNLHLLLYNAPETVKWITVNQYASSLEAIAALDALIDLLINISIKSEGFYLLEHILLRPQLSAKDFGFRFYNEEGVLLLESRTWNFRKREKKISELINLLSADKPVAQIKEVLLHDYVSQTKGGYLSDDLIGLIKGVKQCMESPESGLPRFEMTVRYAKKMISEDYFNFRMSVLLPEWPARFQDDVFKEFVKDLFRVHTPVHLRLKFYWLNIQQMTVFEGLYGSWLTELKSNDENQERIASLNLSHFLTTLQ